MTSALAHRGPDDEGYFLGENVSLGHRRLTILDPAGGRQPMQDMTGRYTLIYNGEVYNYEELREELEAVGNRFATRSDGEVVLRALMMGGADALSRFDGMFALSFWDAEKQVLLLARDRIGIKPLYYFRDRENLAFASELKALLKHPAAARTLNPLSLSKFFTYGYVPAPETIFSGIHKVEPGEYIRFYRAHLLKKFYWNLPLMDHPVGGGQIDECSEEVLRLMREGVRRQLRSDVPAGVFLSGGIDSSAITALAAQETSGLHSFSIGFEDRSYDESVHAKRIAAMFGTVHHEEVLTLKSATELFPKVMEMLDEPLADASIFPTFKLSQLASRHVKVVLGGDGGDELFAGYPAFQAHRIVQWLSFLPVGWRDWLGNLAKRLPVSHHYASLDFLTQQFLKGLGLAPEVRFLLWMGFYSNAEKSRLFSNDFRETLVGTDAFEDVQRHVNHSGLDHDFQRLQYLCTKLYFQDNILAKVDRASMANSLEVRVPFMSNDLVEYACRIQPHYKLHGLTTKYVLKRAFKGLLPENIINRRKAGFMLPVARWLANDLRGTVEDLCNESEISKGGIFNAAYIRRMLDDHFARRRDHRKQIYPLVCFLAWQKNYGG